MRLGECMEINLMLGDCLERMKEIPDGSVDMVLTDPPYGMDFQSNRRVVNAKFAKIANDKSLDWVDSFIDECHRVLCYIFLLQLAQH